MDRKSGTLVCEDGWSGLAGALAHLEREYADGEPLHHAEWYDAERGVVVVEWSVGKPLTHALDRAAAPGDVASRGGA